MDGFDLRAARLFRLKQDLGALLPDDDPLVRQTIFRLLSIGLRDELDLFPRFRDEVQRRSKGRAGSVPAEHDDGQSSSSALEMEVLREPQRATLWPYRPKRLPGELLSSWLWRIARGLGAPPKRFALDAIGVPLADVDRAVDDAAVARLAFFSGQSEEHLLRGTLRADVPMRSAYIEEDVQQALLRHGDLVLNRSRRGRSTPIIQYCPICLGRGAMAHLRRGWRFSIEVVCSIDGCFLLDACWRCGGLLSPLSLTVPCSEFLCIQCGASLAKAPSLRMDATLSDQLMLYSGIAHLAFLLSSDVVSVRGEDYIATLSSGDLRGTNPANSADRHNAVMLEAARWRQVVARAKNKRASRIRAVRKAAATSIVATSQAAASRS
jgi:TniQ